jgi:hypothetical protein
MIRRRHVFYIAGYDPQGVAGYYRLFLREIDRARKIWPIAVTVSEPESDVEGIAARWRIEASGPNWSVTTTYEFLRWDDIVARDMARPMWIRVPRSALCFLERLFDGTIARIFRANWRFGIFYLYPTACVLLAVVVPALAGAVVASLLEQRGLAPAASVLAGIAAGLGAYLVARRLAERGDAIQMADSWLWFRDWAHGRRPDFVARLDVFARRIVARARAADVDEIVVVGHSGGGACAIPVIARALEIDPGFAGAGPPVSVLGLATSLPLAAFHPRSTAVREAIRRVAVERSVRWVDCQARKDVINFPNFDPVAGVGIEVGDERRNPIVWVVRLRDLLAPELYARLRWSFFRMHFQFIMANDRRGPYDYLMMTCGPAPVLDWATDGLEVVARFSEAAAYDA